MQENKRVVRPKVTKSAHVHDPYDGMLGEGDVVELSITAEIKTQRGRTFWVKGGAQSTVRLGETTSEAKDRVAAFVVSYVDEQISGYLAD